MNNSEPNAAFHTVVRVTGTRLREVGYSRSGQVMRKLVDGNVAIVSFQRSQWNTSTSVAFTVNLAVICGQLWQQGTPPLMKAGEIHGHIRQRIGFLRSPPHDEWWELEPGTDVIRVAQSVSDLIIEKGVPYLSEHVSTEKVYELLVTGRSPGLSPLQIDKFRRQLTN